jgi:heptaprenyl diphosphate synthase/octaprenyl-diphosphate synthase
MIAALGTFGHELGMAFQIVDDILDMTEAASMLGKPVGNDLREGTITLPLIHAVQRSTDPRLRSLGVGPVPHDGIADLIELIVEAGGIEASYGTARECIDRALAAIAPFADPQIYQALSDVTTIVLHRRS